MHTIDLPVIGLCGYSGSGKTTLIERLIPELIDMGLKVGVVKLVHGMQIDQAGKDSDRFFRAGATVFAHDPHQGMLRLHDCEFGLLPWGIRQLGIEHDIVLVEGHKSTPLPVKIWIQSESGEDPPQEIGSVLACLGRDVDRLSIAREMILGFLSERARNRPIIAGLFYNQDQVSIPVSLVDSIRPFVERVVFIGDGFLSNDFRDYSRISPVPDIDEGIGGIVAALRWIPDRRWLFIPDQHKSVDVKLVTEILDRFTPGIWAVVAKPHAENRMSRMLSCIDSKLGADIVEMKDRALLARESRVSVIELK